MAESRFISNGHLLLEADVAELERLHQEIKALPDAEALCIWLHTTIPLRWHENLTAPYQMQDQNQLWMNAYYERR